MSIGIASVNRCRDAAWNVRRGDASNAEGGVWERTSTGKSMQTSGELGDRHTECHLLSRCTDASPTSIRTPTAKRGGAEACDSLVTHIGQYYLPTPPDEIPSFNRFSNFGASVAICPSVATCHESRGMQAATCDTNDAMSKYNPNECICGRFTWRKDIPALKSGSHNGRALGLATRAANLRWRAGEVADFARGAAEALVICHPRPLPLGLVGVCNDFRKVWRPPSFGQVQAHRGGQTPKLATAPG